MAGSVDTATVTVRLDREDLHVLLVALDAHEMACDTLGSTRDADRARTLIVHMRAALRGLG